MSKFPFTSLRDWIEFLDQKNLLANNKEEADLRGDIAAIARRICATDAKAVLHSSIKGYPGWKIFSDGLTTRERQALALGMEEKGLIQGLEKKLKEQARKKPKIVDDGPCKEVKITGDEIGSAHV